MKIRQFDPNDSDSLVLSDIRELLLLLARQGSSHQDMVMEFIGRRTREAIIQEDQE
jgi:hypothetical protein